MNNGEKMHINSIMLIMIIFSCMVLAIDTVSVKLGGFVHESIFATLHILQLAIVVLLIVFKKVDILKMYKLKNISRKLVFISFAAGLLVMFLTSSIEQLLNAKIIGSTGTDDFSVNFTWIFILLFAGFIAPIIEEIEFRGLLFGKLQDRNRISISAIILVSFMFMILHTGEIHISAMILSIVSCIMYFYTRNLLYSSIAHFSGNIFLVIMSFVVMILERTTDAVKVSEETDYIQGISYFSLFIEVFLLIALIAFVVHYCRKFKAMDSDYSLESSDNGNNVFTSISSRVLFTIEFLVYTIICVYSTYILIKYK